MFVAGVKWESPEAVLVYGHDFLPLGEMTVLFGANDSGKSTTLEVLADLMDELVEHKKAGLTNSILLSFKNDRPMFDATIAELGRLGIAPERAGKLILTELDLAEQEPLLEGYPNLSDELVAAPIFELAITYEHRPQPPGDDRAWDIGVALSAAYEGDMPQAVQERLRVFAKPGLDTLPPNVDPAILGPPQRPFHLGALGRVALPLVPRVLRPAGTEVALVELEHAVERARRAFRRWAESFEMPVADEDPKNPWWDVTGTPDRFLMSLMGAVEARSSEALPDFVVDRYRFDFDTSSEPHEPGRTRLNACIAPRADLIEHRTFSDKFPVSSLASGLQLWAELAIWEAVTEVDFITASLLIAAHPLLSDQLDQPGSPREYLNAARERWPRPVFILNYPFLSSPAERAWQLKVWSRINGGVEAPDVFNACSRALRPRLTLLDEPERHLNAKIARQAARWLQSRVGGPLGQIVVATHSPAFLACNGASVRHVHVRRTTNGVLYSAFTPDDQPALDEIAHEMNLDEGELFAMRAVVWVEGKHDRAVVEALCGEELRKRGAYIATYGGVGNIDSILTNPLARLPELRFLVLVDDLSAAQLVRLSSNPEYVRPDDGPEAQQASKLLLAARTSNRQLEVCSHGQPDIFFTLDDHALELLGKTWPGKLEVLRQAQDCAIKKGGLKGFVSQYGLQVDERTCRAAAALMKEEPQPAWITQMLEWVGSSAVTA
jgi:energy-coupling factor transporter ATP-binding protein EcfA2